MSVVILPRGELGSMGVRHALDWLGHYAQQSGVRSARIVSPNDDVHERLVFRAPVPLSADPSGIDLFPFLDLTQPDFCAPHVAGFFRNTFSYRRLIHPFESSRSLMWLKKTLFAHNYQLIDLRGVYPPVFMFWWTLSLAAGSRFPALHFQWEERAFRYLGSSSPFSHLVVFHAKRNS